MEADRIDAEYQHASRQTGDDEAHDRISEVGAPEARVPERGTEDDDDLPEDP